MNPEKLYRKKGEDLEVVKYFCTKCGRIYSTEEMAELCCTPITCSKCGRVIERNGLSAKEVYYENPIRCTDCYNQEREAKRPMISEEEYYKSYPDIPVCDSFGDYYDNLAEYKDCNYDTNVDYVYLCEIKKVVPIDISYSIERAMDKMELDEGDAEQVYSGLKELEELVAVWNKKQIGEYWKETETRVEIDWDNIGDENEA